MGPTVLLVDDDENILTVLSMRLKAGGYRAVTAKTKAEAVRATVDEGPDVVLSDLRLDEEDGLDVMEAIHGIDSGIPVLIITAHGSIPNAIEAMEKGAAGYLTKPIDRNELFAQLARCVEQRQLAEEVQSLRRAVDDRAELEGIIGKSAAMKKVFELVERVAPTTTTVLVHGESGTGKELVAKAVHSLSPRANRSFVAVNCAALPDTLLQSELFGYKKGAFTDARTDKDGLFQAADGGTLFLDEIGDISPTMQRALLRVLQEGEVTPLGGGHAQKVDVRVVVATNKDLAAEVEAGSFRQDLYFRLHVVPIHLPQLRERDEDVALLARHFLARFNDRHNKNIAGFTPEALAVMEVTRWPGNVRELENTVERAVILCDNERIDAADLAEFGDTVSVDTEDIVPLREARDAFERAYLMRLLRNTNGNVSAAARQAGKYRADLYGLLKKHALDPGDYK
ncbi:MAG: sigma-54-dependent Fis family transcriptional regulator [Proteobacteria bacterium]|nr:sigma-54-dependent Fis family transcriptional regulator [Pseudomonadota bacterium]